MKVGGQHARGSARADDSWQSKKPDRIQLIKLAGVSNASKNYYR